METDQELEISNIIDGKGMGGLQYWTIALCSLAIFLDGFDTQVIGFVAPAIIHDWKVDRSSLGPVFASGLVGLLMGSLLLGRAADKFGRKPTIIFSTVLFAICMLATAYATELRQLIVLWLITGIGLGSIIPNAASLVGEYTPRHRRASTVNALSVAFTVGAAASAFLASVAVPRYGWRSVFYIGGLVPLVLAGLMILYLPESLRLLVLHKKCRQAVRWYKRLSPAAGEVDPLRFVVTEPSVTGSAVTFLFKGMRSTNDALQSKVAERLRCGSDAGQRGSEGIFQGSSAS
ncbi:MFS transporter [Paraburkholderia panacisoli]|uniref:MFS transporter n=1 Tax=Paraburkholderia panacisoli TaxID=2603818 RepID=A0A5B0FXX4_9BURK|nr:MFS transporter [Paraburkholderia panacisoli]KAA0996147.1 MFS transporter [Paraburkholderia panacisoli]